jgi:hypothetical protein
MTRHWLLLGLIGAGGSTSPASPPQVGQNSITVSGMSSGGHMASQLHVAYSDLFSGAAILAGGPYGCAEGSLATATSRCMARVDGPLPLDDLEAAIREAAEAGKIADPQNLKDDKVWIFRGALDPLVAAEVSEAVHGLYLRFLDAENVRSVNDVQATHTFPTLNDGSACDKLESPFVGACDYDGAGELLSHLYGRLTAPSTEGVGEGGSLRSVPLAGAAEAGLMDEAWAFVPEMCGSDSSPCRIHVVLHGCLQSVEKVDMAFIEHTGYLRWAAANGIVLLFPQVRASAVNPYGCWDWWGYTGDDYRFREGSQMKVIAEFVRGMRDRG